MAQDAWNTRDPEKIPATPLLTDYSECQARTEGRRRGESRAVLSRSTNRLQSTQPGELTVRKLPTRTRLRQEFIRNSSSFGREVARPPIMCEHSKQGSSGGRERYVLRQGVRCGQVVVTSSIRV
jgi:hypothetical protein